MPTAGGEIKQVTFDPSPDWRPSVSPNGQQVAFYAYRTGVRELWRMPVNGGPAKQLTFGGSVYHPAWSPDGAQIAYSAIQEGTRWMYLIPADGGQPRRIGAAGDNLPAWSPDGKRLAFSSAGSDFAIVDDRGEEITRVHHERTSGHPLWSPDGNFLVYTSINQIRAIDLRTRVDRAVVDLAGRPGVIGQFSLAADSKRLYFAWQTPTADIWLMDVKQP
jgi:Tol biopolymer transport system component